MANWGAFFSPRRVWLFVILVSSISYAGYFLQKFLGASRGLALTGLLGGLASTTAATAAFAKDAAETPENLRPLWQATVIANAAQFPRVTAVLFVMSPALATATLVPLAVMTVVGLGLAYLLSTPDAPRGHAGVPVGNPFRLGPALKFGGMFVLILFAVKAATARFGTDAVYWTSLIAGSVDVDAVVVTLSDLFGGGLASIAVAAGAVLIALAANAVLKTGLAFYAGTRAFGWRVAVAFGVMFAAGTVAYFMTF
jgi:uncharacterized membrane protein (DUF4010 family)